MSDLKNNSWIPKVGQGIFVLDTNKRYIITSLITADSLPFYEPKPNDVVSIEVTNKYGFKIRDILDQVRPETFCEYLTRPTGIGRISWSQVIFTLLIMTFGHAISIITWNENGWFGTLLLFLVLVLFGWGHSTWRNFKNVKQQL